MEESLYAKSEGNMVFEANRLVNGDSEMSFQKQRRGISRNGISGKHKNLGSNGTGASCSNDEISGDEDILTVHARDVDDNMDVEISPDVVVSVSRMCHIDVLTRSRNMSWDSNY